MQAAETDPVTSREIAFRRPSWLPRWLILLFGRLALVIAATLLSVPPKPGAQNTLPVLLCIEFAIVAAVIFGAQARLRLRGGPPPILLGAETITLPRNALSARSATVPYADVQSVTVIGRGRTAQLVIDTKARRWRIPVDNLESPDALPRLQDGLHQHVISLPGGEARWAAIARRHLLAERIGSVRPWGSWGITLVAMLCFAAQAILLKPTDGFAFIDAGANAALLVQAGQWFRLVTASLLHENARHVVGNLLFVLTVGSVLEPLIGLRRIVLVMLWSCLASQVVSAVVGLHHGGYVYALGNSGGVYGLIGALASITWRYGTELPGAYRLPVRAWVLVGVSILAFPFVIPHVDHAAHAGGFVAGALACLLMLGRRRQIENTGAPSLATNAALAVVACLWVAGVAAAALHAANPAALAADRYTLAAGMLTQDHFPPSAKNFVAWAIATDQAAPPSALRAAQELARSGVMEESNARGPYTAVGVAIRDTEAVLSHRLGQDDQAIRMELPLLAGRKDATAHLTDFVEAAWRKRRLTVHGNAGPAPALAIGQGVLVLSTGTEVAVQTDVLALLHRDNAVAGLLRFQLMPGFTGTQILPLPSNRRGPSLAPPPAIWTDGKSTIDIALLDANGCHCDWPTMVPAYFPYEKATETAR